MLNQLGGARPRTLVNLSPGALFSAPERVLLDGFADAIKAGPIANFMRLTWSDLLDDLNGTPAWLVEFCRGRRGLMN